MRGRKTTHETQKWIIPSVYWAPFMAAYNARLVAFNYVGFFRFFNQTPNTVACNINEGEIARCLKRKRRDKKEGLWTIQVSDFLTYSPESLSLRLWPLHPKEPAKQERAFTAYRVAGRRSVSSHWRGLIDLPKLHFFSVHPPSIIASNVFITSLPWGGSNVTRKLLVVIWLTATFFGSLTNRCQCQQLFTGQILTFW